MWFLEKGGSGINDRGNHLQHSIDIVPYDYDKYANSVHSWQSQKNVP